MPNTDRPLLVGVGNRDRGDDAVGPLVTEAVTERFPGIADHAVLAGDLTNLALLWRSDQKVVIVDALVSGRAPGTVIEVDALKTAFPTSMQPTSSHGIGLVEAIELARVLGRLPAELTVVAVEGAEFELFTPLSDAVAGAVGGVIDRVASIIVANAGHTTTSG